MDKQLLLDGLQLLILGMGTVYVFLIIMIWLIKLTAKLLSPYANMMEAPVAAPKKTKTAVAADSDVAAAAVVAVELFRNR